MLCRDLKVGEYMKLTVAPSVEEREIFVALNRSGSTRASIGITAPLTVQIVSSKHLESQGSSNAQQ